MQQQKSFIWNWLRKSKKLGTTVRNLDYENYKQQRQETFEKQTKDAKKEREEYQKTMEKHRRVKQSVEHVLRNTHDSTAGRLVAKKMKTSSHRANDLREKRLN